MTRGSLRLRLLLAGAISILLALALSATGLTVLFYRHVERRVDTELGVFLDQIVSGLAQNTETGALELTRAPSDPRFEVPLSGLYWQVSFDDTVLRSRSLWDNVLQLPDDELTDGALHRHVIPGPVSGDLLTLERSVKLSPRAGGQTVRVAAAITLSDVRSATRDFAFDMLPYLILLALFLIGAAYIQVTIGLRPLHRIRQRLRVIRQDPDARFGTAGFPQEIEPMALELDTLLTDRQTRIEKARARAGDLAHGLKTPLQVLLGDVERLRSAGLHDIAEDVEHVAHTMQRHVERELARARLATGTGQAVSNIGEAVNRVVSVVSRTPAGAALDWALDVDEQANVVIDPDDLAEALGNLLENAARHARSHVKVRTVSADGRVTIRIEDDGPGIPEDQIEKMLERGGRLDQSTSGAGLGLAIVQEIADVWGGTFRLCPLQPGLAVELGFHAISDNTDDDQRL
ncbi:HAMP domain-containing sensor histidine kinase [uncultured Roseibium sp.]|uniref:sensor histidine kinase n=1 Tax=uncultured Roseibium sp. TaxID=1936171 RepID=UPI0032176408